MTAPPRWSAPRRPEAAPDLPYVDYWFHADPGAFPGSGSGPDTPRALARTVEAILAAEPEAAS